MNSTKLLTVDEVEAQYRLDRVSQWRYRAAKKLSHFKIGTRIYYAPEHLTAFLAAHERPAINGRKRGEAA